MIKTTVKKIIDSCTLVLQYPKHCGIFFRDKYDAIYPVLRPAAKLYKSTVLKDQRTIAIVGSLGKSTTTRAIQRIFLEHPFKQSYSNYDSCLAENIFRSSPKEKYGVFEVGINCLDVMGGFADLVGPDIVVVTAVKSEHSRTFGTLEVTRGEKVRMVKGLKPGGVAILNGDDENVMWMKTQTDKRVVTFGLNEGNDVRAKDVMINGLDGCAFTVVFNGRHQDCKVPLLGKHMIYPVLGAIACGLVEGKSLESLAQKLSQMTAAPSRMQKITLPNGCIIVDDTFKAAWESYLEAFDWFSTVKAKRKIMVLGDVQEPPMALRKLYQQWAPRIAGLADQYIFIGGQGMSKYPAILEPGPNKKKAHWVGSSLFKALDILKGLQLQAGDVIYIKGRGLEHFDRIVHALNGQTVACDVKHCSVKAETCLECPLLSKKVSDIKNFYIQKLVRS